MSKAYGYVRVSTAWQAAHGISLDAQQDVVRKYFEYACKGKWEWGGIVRDPAKSGHKLFRQRPGGLWLCNHVQPGDCVIFPKYDRGFRNFVDLSLVVEPWLKQGVVIKILDMNVDTATETGLLLLRMLAVFSAHERSIISKRHKESNDYRRSQGGPTNSPNPPWGWKIVRVGRDRKFFRNEDERVISKFLFEMAPSGSYTQMAAWCVANNYCNPRTKRPFSRPRIQQLVWAELDELAAEKLLGGPLTVPWQTRFPAGTKRFPGVFPATGTPSVCTP